MGLIDKAETSLEGLFKEMPKLSEGGREGLAKVWPWLALVFGVLQLVAALSLWRALSWTDDLYSAARALGVHGYSTFDRTMIYVGLAMLIVDAVLLLMAFPKLQKRERSGWRLLFLAALVNLVYSVVTVAIDGRGVMSFIFGLAVSFVGFYLLFQVRDKFSGGAMARKSVSATVKK